MKSRRWERITQSTCQGLRSDVRLGRTLGHAVLSGYHNSKCQEGFYPHFPEQKSTAQGGKKAGGNGVRVEGRLLPQRPDRQTEKGEESKKRRKGR